MIEIVTSPAVASALERGEAVVALESTIFSELGLPRPHSVEALDRVTSAVAAGGAVSALTAVIDGRVRCGVGDEELERICGPARKTASRELGMAVAQSWPYGATTVSASVTIAAAAGVPVFATGGIGGVHRNSEVTGDISADLPAISRSPVITVTAGAKVFLDLARTVEYLETVGVPLIGWGCREFPAFHARSSGVALSMSSIDPNELADLAIAHWGLGGGGIVVANPIPEEAAIDRHELDRWVDHALEVTGASQQGGKDVTPAVLAALAEVSEGRTIQANLALAESNARVAAEIAGALAVRSDR
ncbi:MAG: pseudouridine-5'-phosphate glycosidase [Acidimicrobiia bacterium]|nr:pseudouridine-5'-phosphate glycosidase [Acidimicrobiia bacterium]